MENVSKESVGADDLQAVVAPPMPNASSDAAPTSNNLISSPIQPQENIHYSPEVYARALDGISQFVRLPNGEERGRKEQAFQQGMSDFMHLGTNFSVFEYIFRTLRPVEGLGPEHPELVATKLLESAARLVAIIAGPQEDPLNVMEAVLTTTTEKMGAYVLELQASAGKDTSTERAVGVAKAFLKLCDSVRPDVAQMRTALRVYEKRR